MRDAPLMYRGLKAILPPVMNRMFHVMVEGLEHVPTADPAILAMNHLSFIDSIFVPLNVDRPIYYLGKADYWDSWRTRWFFQGVGVVPIDRSGGDASSNALTTGVRILRGGDLLGIYPEGTRSPDGRLYRGKTGPVRIALEARAPIVPVGLVGTDHVMPTGSRIPRRHPVTVRYGRPLDFSRYAERADDPFALRSATDELMYEIMMLSGQEYVDEYADKVKSGQVSLDAELESPAAADGAEAEESDEPHRRAS